jgi:hypothetical protein
MKKIKKTKSRAPYPHVHEWYIDTDRGCAWCSCKKTLETLEVEKILDKATNDSSYSLD